MSTRRAAVGLRLYALLYMLFLYLPMAMIPLFSLNDSIYVALPLKGLTLHWYADLLGNSQLGTALRNSLMVALAAATLATVAGTLTAYAVTRRGAGRGTQLLLAGAAAPLFIPGVVLGIALLVLATLAGLGPSLTAVALAHACLGLPIAVLTMKGRFEGYSRAVEEAAADLGAGPWTVLRRISLPIAAPGIAASFLLAFTTSFDEFIVAFFLVGTDPTLPIYIWGQLRFPNQLPGVLALGSLILMVSVVLVLAAERLRRRGTTARAAPPIPLAT
jgi:spermidine/putrescine transport system permease protein